MTERRLTVHVLGRADLALGGHPLTDLASVKASALLIYLSVTGTAHPRSALAGLLWSDLPEATARANLRLVLTKLRRVVPDHLDVTRQRVAVTGVWVDAVEVARAVTAPGLDDAAVRLCRGEFLHGFDVPGAALFDDWVAARRAEARTDMLALLDRAVRQARDRADPAAGVEAARRMLDVDRLHEEAHRTLMWFLAAGGQRAAAVAQYETCRYLLGEELGVDPSAATTALRDEIAGAAEAPPPVPPQPPAPAPPRPLTALIGRAAELARLHRLLDDPACRLATLIGPGGVGKTRLAVELADARRDRRRHGVVFVSFAGLGAGTGTDADVVVAGLAAAFGVGLTVPRDPLDLLVDHVRGRELLLVLDNLEHLPGAAAPIAALLRRAPGVQLLATSRRPLGLGVEWLVEVPGLPFPPAGAGGAAAGYAAVQLFQERARLLRPGVEADVEGIARICRLVAGLPLAIELAARWVRSAAPGVIADRLAHGLELLETGAPDVEPRHRSIRSVIDASMRLLTEEERRALRRLSVQHGFDLAAAEAVADAGLPLLAGLIDQSLITAGPDGRYAMHELLRQYAAGRLAEDPAEEAETRRRHAVHYDALLTAEPAGVPALDAANLRAAGEWFTATADPDALDAHLRRVWIVYRRAGWFREAQAVIGTALRRPDVPELYRGRWHRLLGEAHQQLGEAGAARQEFERALAVLGAPVPGSGGGLLAMLVVQFARRLRPGTPAPAGGRRREVHQERAATCFAINEVYWVLDEHRLMLPVSLLGLNDVERSGDADLTALIRAGHGMIVGSLGLRRLARRHLALAVATAERRGEPVVACWLGIVGGLHWTGVADWAAVDAAAARALARPAAPLHRWADDVRLVAGVAQHLTGRHAEAVAAAAECVAAGRERRDPVVHLWGLLLLIEATLRADPADPALDGWLLEASALLPHAATVDAARCHTAAARAHLAAGRREQAWQAVRTADRLLGPRPARAQYGLDAHAGVAEVCQALLDDGGDVPAELRRVEATAVRRLRRYARRYPMAGPRALLVLGRHLALRGRTRAARRAWSRAARDAERLRMPPEAARAADLRGSAPP
ncbi:hypothetical protein Daura_33500 [Dactylosporangium aurantiacum]|uniref:Bacterial transcriptional activator domain-containing protein n=1 Tax=Dactylosporangium aurantiacum TaxID=35754 RepID=A0A9Q9IC21_9ACTN|nr:BTAD domain-containing putative transcriptional regulator [Dactylosporangium aurantiacum]MDG6105110.1 BTAD domain-containing putative transcriptional regulator [Dactylosporangium aurantiacum]UWZ51635.1 hypothetical protein Daura_33500 [Dactylosporangium aurantiacum]